MTVLVDTSILIDLLRGNASAAAVLQKALDRGPLHTSEITRLEVLGRMRPEEESATRALFRAFVWHPVDEGISEIAGQLGREWIPRNRGIDSADLAIAATAQSLNVRLLTKNVKHFPMFDSLTAPY